jgi:hypothetical protein
MSMDRENATLLAASVREVFAGPTEHIGKLLDDLGWDEAVTEDPAFAATILFREQGRSLARTALLDRVLIAELTEVLPGKVDAVCYPPDWSGDRPADASTRVAGILLARPVPSAVVLCVCGGPDAPSIGLLPARELDIQPLPSIDDELEWFSATGSTPASPVPSRRWPDAVAAAQRALAAEILGTGGELLRLAVEHTSVRKQYGAPIAAFQSVRHRLAEAHVHLTGAQALLEAAFLDGSPTAAAAAKAAAGRAHERASAAAVQVCGAIGASLEHPLHRYVNRGTALDALLGSHRDLASRLGAQLLETGETPLLVEV